LKLPPGRGRVLEFRYTANTFVAPEKAQFRYRMIGLESNWIDVGTRREVFFTDLRPGAYEFEVIAANHHGVWPERGARMAVHLAPFIYQTWWFYAVCGITTVTLVGGSVMWRLRELRRIHRLQQQAAIVTERTRIAKDLHDGLGADLSRLTLLADLAGGEPGADTGEHIQKLSRTSRQAARDLKELIWLANPANDTVEGLVSRICQTAEDLLRDARIRCRLDVAPHLPPYPLSLEQRRNLLLVVREALNNILKHAAATEVWLRAHARGGGLQLVIEDNGRGFDPASVQPGTLGLMSMRQRIENLGGTFTLESRPGTGTKLAIEIKLAGQL
jgi:signal transduction histidine kinase